MLPIGVDIVATGDHSLPMPWHTYIASSVPSPVSMCPHPAFPRRRFHLDNLSRRLLRDMNHVGARRPLHHDDAFRARRDRRTAGGEERHAD
jgi:hypothetical protein